MVRDAAARTPGRWAVGRNGAWAFGVPLLFWSAIEVWTLLLNRLNAISPSPELAPAQLAGICGAAAISFVADAILRRAPDQPGPRFALGAACAVAGSALYAGGMVALARWMPVPHPAGARGLAQFASRTESSLTYCFHLIRADRNSL